MKRAIVLAASLLTTPVSAQDCETVHLDIPYLGVVIHQTANTKNHSFCVGFSPNDARVDSISPSQEKPTCVDVNGDPEQAIVPLLYLKSGGVVAMEVMQTPEAKRIYDMMVDACNRPEGVPASFIGAKIVPKGMGL